MPSKVELMKKYLDVEATITRFVCYDPRTYKWVDIRNGRYVMSDRPIARSCSLHETIKICIETNTMRCNERMWYEMMIERKSSKRSHLKTFHVSYRSGKETPTAIVQAKNADDAFGRSLPVVRKTAFKVWCVETNVTYKVDNGSIVTL